MLRTYVGRRIKQAREELGLTQEELAKMYGASGGAISQLESGNRAIRLDTLERLAQLLGKPLPYFVPEPQTAEGMSITQLLHEIEAAFNSTQTVTIRIRGSIRRGVVTYKEQDQDDFALVPREYLAGASKPYALRVVGGNLGRDIKNDDIIIVDPSAAFVSGKLYIIWLRGQMSIRRVFQEDDKLRLKAPGGNLEVVDQSEIHLLGRVIVTGRWIQL